jgi:uncharacterized protein (TIGR03000 family)
MHRTRLLPAAIGIGLALLIAMRPSAAQESNFAVPAYLVVYVPANAQLTIDNFKTLQTGTVRRFESPVLPPGQPFTYHVKASWSDGKKEIVNEKDVRVVAGQETKVDFRQEQAQERSPDVVYVPTPQDVVDKMLELANVKKDDVVYDLGCGDGRIVVTAAKKYGCKAVGFDIDPDRVRDSMANVKKNKVEDLVTIKKADIFTLDLSEASVVTLYLLPELNVKLMPQLAKLKPGSRIVSHDFNMRGAKPLKEVKVKPQGELEREHTVFFWIVPWEKE